MTAPPYCQICGETVGLRPLSDSPCWRGFLVCRDAVACDGRIKQRYATLARLGALR